MGFCPNCGSWVDEGDACGCCGGSGSYENEYKKSKEERMDDMHLEFAINEILYVPEKRTDNAEIKRGMDLLDDYRNYTDEYIIGYLYEKLERQLEHNNKNKHYREVIERAGREKRILIGELKGKYSEGHVIRLEKESEDNIVAYDETKQIGTVVEDSKRYGKHFLKASELKKLPKIFYARYMCPYPLQSGYESCSVYIAAELLDDDSPAKTEVETKFKEYKKLLEQYSKKELIIISGTSKYYPVFKKGMELKLIKEPDGPYDKDVIAVYANNDKAGNVGNWHYDSERFYSLASEIIKYITNETKAVYLMKYGDYHIARLILP